jgi:hypothetical protein
MRKSFVLIVLAALAFTSCENNPVKKVDISNDEVQITTSRFDRELFAADFQNPLAARQQLYQKYGSWFCDYMEVILSAAPCSPDSNFLSLKNFVEFPDMRALQQEIEKRHPQSAIDEYNADFQKALSYHHHYFPEEPTPHIVYMNSGFNFSAYSTDSVISVGLDFFLGPEDSIMQLLPADLFPVYMRKDMDPKYLVVNAMKDFCWSKANKYLSNEPDKELLEIIVHQGKVLYMCDAFLPFTEDSLKMNWSTKEIEWAEAHEWNVWKELANDKVLFGKELNENKKWIDFGPFTNAANIPNESPSQLGIWIGWQMVRAYMKDNPEVTLSQLLAEQNAQKILKSYKPSKP